MAKANKSKKKSRAKTKKSAKAKKITKRFVLLQLRGEHFEQLALAAHDAGIPPTTFVRRATKAAVSRAGYSTKAWSYAEREI